MNKRQKLITLLCTLLSVLFIIAAGAYYIMSVSSSMENQSVTDILEITSQGRHAFDVYSAKSVQMLHNLTINIAEYSSDDDKNIISKLSERSESETEYIVINKDTGVMYTNRSDKSRAVESSKREKYFSLDGKGIAEPGVSGLTGRNVLSLYESFQFSDGTSGIVIGEQLLSSVASEFSIDFFDGAGFSYVVNDEGKILIRSNHKNVRRTFENIFDIIDIDGNDENKMQEFSNSLKNKESGTARFMYGDEDYVFTYVPVSSIDGWYYISIIPHSVIAESTENVVKSSQIMIFITVAAIAVLAAVMLITRQNSRSIMEKDLEIAYHEQLFSIFSNNTDQVFLMFSSGSSSAEYVSPNIERVMGISAKEAAENISAINRTLCSHENEISPEIIKNITPGSPVSFERERIHEKNGEHRWFTETIYCAEAGKTSRLIAVISDKTEEKRNQKALEDALAIAKTANEAKSAFLSNMSHDIRTPMNAIIGLSSLLQRDADKPDKVREHTRKIVSSSQHMLGLINDILDMSKIESGKTTLNISEINLADIVEELGTIIRPQAKAKRQNFSISVRGVSQEHLLGDRLRIEQIMINLLSNAVKYTPEDGKIEMTIMQIPQSAKNYAHLRFIVRDNGMGMSEEFRQQIFSPFTRETNSVTNKIQGTGLGMAITKNLVDLMGGTISVESVPGNGSVFTVDLELRLQKRDIDRSFWISRGITRMLAVDGDMEVCADIAGAMAGTGVYMQYASDGESALKAVRDAHLRGADFNLVLIDRETPVTDGVETARLIKNTVSENPPVIILTGCDRNDTVPEAEEAGITGFLPKPFFLSNLKQELERISAADGEGSEAAIRGSLENKRVLIAEDNEINLEILLELLSDIKGLVCVTAANGREALDKFTCSEPGEYDIVLMDVQMPVMNGYEAAKAIRASGRPDSETIPIVAMTANAFAEDVKAALDSGMNAHLSKPVDLDRIIEVLLKFTVAAR